MTARIGKTTLRNLIGVGTAAALAWGNFPSSLSVAADPVLNPSADAPAESEQTRPPIPVKFKLAEPGYVTLVIERPDGTRVRNLVSETPFPAGENVVYWDGLDDVGRDLQSAKAGVYHVPGKLVDAGSYRVRGLVRPELKLTYELSLYNRGNPPWITKDRSGGWLTNHSPASAVLFVPESTAPQRAGKPTPSGGQVLIGSHIAEGGSGLAWVDLDGNKLHGQMWIGGVWTGATRMARDEGDNPVPGVYAYAGAPWKADKYNGYQNELRLHTLVQPNLKSKDPGDKRMGTGEDPKILEPTYKYEKLADMGEEDVLGGLAVRNGILVASMPYHNRLVFVDVRAKRVLAEASAAEPRGIAFDPKGRLFAISGKTITCYPTLPQLAEAGPTTQQATMPQPQVIVGEGALQDPRQLCLDDKGNIYVSDWGDSHQVKMFSPAGKLIRTMGKGGKPTLGKYDQTAMRHPNGITVDARGRLWVAETDKSPKRTSLWNTADGKLVTAFYGPAKYGGGGTIDPLDKTRAFYVDEDGSAMEFKINWETGETIPTTIYKAANDAAGKAVPNNEAPETPIHADGRTYLTDCFSAHPTNGTETATLWVMNPDGTARRVAAVGQANNIPAINPTSGFSVRWTGKVLPEHSQTYTFTVESDDGARMWVNGKLLLDRWYAAANRMQGTIDLKAGQPVDVRLEYFQRGGPAKARLLWASKGQPEQIIPTERLYPDGEEANKGKPGTGLTGEYFSTIELEHPLEKRIDPKVDFAWGTSSLKLAQPSKFLERLPAGTDIGKDRIVFAWSDSDGDGQMQPDEVTFTKGEIGGVVVMADLSVVTAKGLVLKPSGFNKHGAPLYDATKSTSVVSEDVTQKSPSSGGNQALLGRDGSIVFMNAPKPFASAGPGGVSADGRVLWSYPSLWPGLHASHNAAMPEQPGTLIGTTRLIGHPVVPNEDVGEVWAVNGNKGNVFLMTTDGLFVATLFKDSRTSSWDFPKAERGMDVSGASLHEENFWPTISQIKADGSIYLQGQSNASVVKLHNLEQTRRLPPTTLNASSEQLAAAREYFQQREVQRQQANKKQPAELRVAMAGPALEVDGDLADWSNAQWAQIDQRVWAKRKTATAAALRVAGDRLYLALKTDDPELLRNSGESINNLFKTGGCIDLMLDSVPGGQRLLVTRVKDKTTAVLYRPKLPADQKQGEPVQFASPLRTVRFDLVKEVSDQVNLASAEFRDAKTNAVTETRFELSVPLSLLDFKAARGARVKGDVGVLRGNGFQTLQRVYWSNKSTGLVSDIPSEAELTPRLWGTFVIDE